jgi:hypothetical protein
MLRLALAAFALVGVPPLQSPSTGQSLPSFDFHQAGTVAEWGALNDIERIEPTEQGMAIHISGPDPYCSGPARDYPGDLSLFLKIRIKPPAGGYLQVFYSGPTQEMSENRSVRAAVKPGVWQELVMTLPPLGAAARLRIDPPGSQGVCLIESIRFEARVMIKAPEWPKPTVPRVAASGPLIQNGPLTLRQDPDALGGFVLSVDSRPFATGHNRPTIGYLKPGSGSAARPSVGWIDVAKTAKVQCGPAPGLTGIAVAATFQDPDGGRWELSQTFQPGPSGAINVTAACSVDAPRDVVFLPLLLILPGHGSFGGLKGQGLFAGVEYLENEPSSSTADLSETAGAMRLVPDSARITFPLMAIQTHGRYLGLIWERSPETCALFDSPDRTLGCEAHLFGLLAPGASGPNRANGQLLPYQSLGLKPGGALQVRATIIGGKGESVMPAVQHYVAMKGLPECPQTADLESFIHLAASGWLDTPIRSGRLFRHAVGESFGAQPAADAAWMIEQLAALTTDASLAGRLKTQAREAAAQVPDQARLHAAIAHVHHPLAPLVLDRTTSKDSAARALLTALEQARAMSHALSGRFEPDGSIRYRPQSDGVDYGRTHFCDEANGLTAGPICELLEAATFAGDRTATEEGLRLLRILQRRFALGVPRGAQTWEIPLHTPDILASAYLVRAFALGYEISGDADLLDSARYWAWTGVPFVFLVNPSGASDPGTVGPFATTPVLGATNWIAPNWIGLPVQWCGLVYADSLSRLALLDGGGPWRKLADGITASAILQTYPIDHPHHGLLPDSFDLLGQSRNPSDINPGTLQPLALRLLGRDQPAATPYQFRALRQSGLWIQAPGAVDVTKDNADEAKFTVRPWSPRPSYLVIHGPGQHRPTLNGEGQLLVIEPSGHPGTAIVQLEGPKPVALEVSIREK